MSCQSDVRRFGWSARFWIGMLLAAAGMLSFTLGASGAESGARGIWVVRNQRPFRDTLPQMLLRDRLVLSEIAAGRRFRPAFVSTPPEKELEEPTRRPERALALPAAVPTSTVPALLSGFAATGMQDEFTQFHGASYPPDTMGAIGPGHFLQVINGAVTIYNRNGGSITRTSLDSFFTFSQGGTSYPRNGSFDPRVLYDRRSGRWFATALEFGSPSGTANHVLLAVSRNSDPTQGFDKYVIPIGEPGTNSSAKFTDFETLGVDDNGVYVGVRIFPNTGAGFAKLAAVPKAALLAGSMSASVFSNITDMFSTPQAAQSFDATPANAPAYIVASSSQVLGNLMYRKLTWNGATPTLSPASSQVSTPAFDFPPATPSLNAGALADTGDVRVLQAVLRNGTLWACRNIGVNRFGSDTGADRSGCEWIVLDVSAGTPSLAQLGRVYDPTDSAVAAPRFYFYPSLGVNGRGDAVLAFSGAAAGEFIGCFYAGRVAGDPAGSLGPVQSLKAGEAAYTRVASGDTTSRWGDYSATSVDPNDDLTLWTTQEYARTPTTNSNVWGTYVGVVQEPGPTLDNPGATVTQGQTGVTVNLTGTGFYDPGAGFPGRLQAQVSGGAVNGISNLTATVADSAHVTLHFDVSPLATPGSRDLQITNPDGQSATVSSALQVSPAASALQFNAVNYTVPETAGNATITLLRSGSLTGAASVHYATSDGTAVAGTDYAAATGTVSFGAGESTGTFTVPVRDNTLLQGDHTVLLALTGAVGAPLGAQSTATLTITDDLASPAPDQVSAQALTQTTIRLQWQNRCANQDGVRIERQVSGGGYVQLTTTGAGATSYTDTGLAPGVTYTYRLRATHGALVSDPATSPPVATPDGPPAAPSGLTAVAVSPTSIALAWTNHAANATGVKIQRQTGTGAFATVQIADPAATGWTDAAVGGGVTYTYQVVATNSLGDSPPSNPVALAVPSGGKLTWSTRGLSFNTVKVGATRTLKLVLKNAGKGVLSGRVGAASQPFAVVAGGGTFTLEPKQSLSVQVRFTPATGGAYSDSIAVTSTDLKHNSVPVSLKGKGK